MIFDKFPCQWIIFSVCVPYSIVSYCLKTRQSTRDTWLGTLMRLDFFARIVCWIYVYNIWTSTEYITLQTVPLVTGNPFHYGGRSVAISDALLEGWLTFEIYLGKGGEGGWGRGWNDCFVRKRCFCKNFCVTYEKTPIPGYLF